MDEELLFRLLFIAIYAVFFGVRIRYRVNSIKREPEQCQKTTSWHIKLLIAAIIGYFVSIALYLLNFQWFQWSQIVLPTWLRWMCASLN